MSESKSISNKKPFIAVGALVLLIAVLAAVYAAFGAKPVAGSKAVTIEVISQSQECTVYELKTDAEFLRQAMEETEGLTFSGAESSYGLMVDTVNEEKADYNANGAYWAFFVNDAYCQYGIDTQPVMDGDIFTIAYTDNNHQHTPHHADSHH